MRVMNFVPGKLVPGQLPSAAPNPKPDPQARYAVVATSGAPQEAAQALALTKAEILEALQKVVSAPLVYTNGSTNGNSSVSVIGATAGENEKLAQSFVAQGAGVTNVEFVGERFGSPGDNLVVSLCSDSSGSPGAVLTSQNVLASSFPVATTSTTTPVTFNWATTSGTTYWIVWSRSGVADGSNQIAIATANLSSDGSANGQKFVDSAWSSVGIGLWISVTSALGGVTSRAPVEANLGLVKTAADPVEALRGLRGFPLSTQMKLQTKKSGFSSVSIGTFADDGGRATSFTPAEAGPVGAVDLVLLKIGSPVDNVVVEIQSDAAGVPSGTVLASATLTASSVVDNEWNRFSFASPPVVSASTRYWIVAYRSGVTDLSNRVHWYTEDDPITYGSDLIKTWLGAWITPGVGSGRTYTISNSGVALEANKALAVTALDPVEALLKIGPAPAAQIAFDTFLGNGTDLITSGRFLAQQFTLAAPEQITSVQAYAQASGSPTLPAIAQIRPNVGGLPGSGILATASLAAAAFTGSLAWETWTYSSPASLPAGTYWIVWSTTDGSGFEIGTDGGSSAFPRGARDTGSGFALGVVTFQYRVDGLSLGDAIIAPIEANKAIAVAGSSDPYEALLGIKTPAPSTTITSGTADTSSGDGISGSGSLESFAQAIQVQPGSTISSVTLSLFRSGTPSDNLVVEIQTSTDALAGVPSGTVVSSGSIAASSVSNAAFTDYPVTLSPAVALSGRYWVVVRRSGARDVVNRIAWAELVGTTSSASGASSSSGTWTAGQLDHYYSASVVVVPPTPLEANKTLASTASDPYEALLGIKSVGARVGAFPAESLLDSFNRANENPLSGGGNWANAWTNLPSNLSLSSNAVTSGGNAASYWTPTVFPDCEASVTLVTYVQKFRVMARVTPGAELSGYTVMYDSGTGFITIHRWDAGASTNLSDTAASLAPGDKLGIRCVGSTIEAWKCVSGVWSLVASVTDTTYKSGYIGLFTSSSVLDDFCGGPASVAPYESEASVSSTPVSQTAAIPFEALLALTKTSADPFESLLGVTKSGVDPYEVLLALARTAADAYESNKGITSTLLSPYEAAKVLAITGATAYESLLALARTGADPFEVNQALARTAQTWLEALQGITALTSDSYEALAGISKSTLVPIEALQSIARTGAAPIESLLALAVTALAQVDAAQAITRSLSDPAEAGQGVTRSTSDPAEALQGVASTIAAWYEALLGVSRTTVLSSESLLGLAALGIDPIEAAKVLNITGQTSAESTLPVTRTSGSDPLEALQGLTRSGVDPLEALQGIATLFAAPYETLLGLTRTGQGALESLQALAVSGQLSAEALQGITQTGLAVAEALLGVRASLSFPLSANQTIRATLGAPTDSESIGGVSGYATFPFEVLAALAVTRSTQAEATQALAVSESSPVEALLGLRSTALASFELLQALALTRATPAEANKAIAASIIAPLSALQKITATQVASIEALRQLAVSSSFPYESTTIVFTAVTQTASLPLDVAKNLAITGRTSADAVQSISTSKSLVAEVVAAVRAAGAENPVEAQQGLSGRILAPLEAAALLNVLAVAPVDTTGVVQAISASVLLPIEALQKLTKTSTDSWEFFIFEQEGFVVLVDAAVAQAILDDESVATVLLSSEQIAELLLEDEAGSE